MERINVYANQKGGRALQIIRDGQTTNEYRYPNSSAEHHFKPGDDAYGKDSYYKDEVSKAVDYFVVQLESKPKTLVAALEKGADPNKFRGAAGLDNLGHLLEYMRYGKSVSNPMLVIKLLLAAGFQLKEENFVPAENNNLYASQNSIYWLKNKEDIAYLERVYRGEERAPTQQDLAKIGIQFDVEKHERAKAERHVSEQGFRIEYENHLSHQRYHAEENARGEKGLKGVVEDALRADDILPGSCLKDTLFEHKGRVLESTEQKLDLKR